VIAWAAGPREAALAEPVVRQTRARTVGQQGVPWVSDGWEPYADLVDAVYRDRRPSGIRASWSIVRPTPGVGLSQMVKHRRGRRLERVEVRTRLGAPVAQPHTVHIERLNGVLRDRLGCLTRKTHAFAKEAEYWDAAVGLVLFEHNWLRPHPALRQALAVPEGGRRYARRTPAMLQGLTDHPWTWHEFLTLPRPHG
jgi:IS1 family transposase